jgi:hypothetical protein
MVKSGKSTLLNAIIGEPIAPTDAGECTKIVTWYRYGDTPRVTLHPLTGEARDLVVRKTKAGLTYDLGTYLAQDVSHLEVHWPVKGLRELTLIDTPGIASLSEDVSARSTALFASPDGRSPVDAVIYLMRNLREADLAMLQSIRESANGAARAINALVVLSRADEVGAGRIDSLLSARGIAERYRNDPQLREVASGFVPVSGLLAQAAKGLRQADFTALAEIAALDRAARERLLVSADRFVAATSIVQSSEATRSALLSRFGFFGIRLAAVLIRGGVPNATGLSRELARRSGLDELLELVSSRFGQRTMFFTADAALAGVEALMAERPHPATIALRSIAEQIRAGAHDVRELRMLTVLRDPELGIPGEAREEAERLVGGRGTGIGERLDLGADVPVSESRRAAMDAIRRWRTTAAHPLTDRRVAELCEVVIRSCEAALAQLPSGDDSGARLMLAVEPRTRFGQESRDQRSAG